MIYLEQIFTLRAQAVAVERAHTSCFDARRHYNGGAVPPLVIDAISETTILCPRRLDSTIVCSTLLLVPGVNLINSEWDWQNTPGLCLSTTC